MTLVDVTLIGGDGAVRRRGVLRSVPVRCATHHTTNQMMHTMLTITKLGGTLNIADTARPAHTETTASAVETPIATPVGRPA